MATFSTFNKAPGVYIQEITVPGPLPQVSTSVTAIVGPAQMGPLLQPTMLTSIQQFNTIFGSYIETPYRSYACHAVNGFFNEGGLTCYFVRVGNGVAASLNLLDQANLVVAANPQQTTLTVVAQQEGTSGNAITVQVAQASIASSSVPTTSTTLSAASTTISVTLTAVAGFQPGDGVTLKQAGGAGLSENATIAGISGSVVTFASPLTNSYPTGSTFRTADLTVGTTQIRLASVTGFQPGSYVHFSNGAAPDSYDVVRVVNQVTNVITITNGLTSSYPVSAGAVTVKTMEFTLTVVSTAAGTEVFSNLAMDPRHSQYYGTIVNSGAVNVVAPTMPDTTPPPLNLPATLAATPLSSGTVGVNDDLATFSPPTYQAGIDTLKKIDIDLLCVPDAVTTWPTGNSHFQPADTQSIQAYMVAHCEQMQMRFAILDANEAIATAPTYTPVLNQRAGLNSDNGYAALYFPWIGIQSPFGSGQIFVPPSGHTAGVYANNDNTYDPSHAPANEPIVSALSLEVTVGDVDQGPLNQEDINVIRSFTNEGILIWGARTIAPPDQTAWTYINVRRLLNMIEKTVKEGTLFAVFQPNNLTLWQQVKRMVSAYLQTLWAAGDLFGAAPDQAYQVRVDATLNTPAVVALGQMIVQVTVVPTHPAEFIVFQVIQDPTGATLQESTSS
ncbi:MAG TPA: phage tail sheath subtilisin-like domain-containing protein [Terriglobales bacterium]|jgi:phage tail sheath protein FI|nr:phage tail sheath subtilisin-like domain-containing protein [Terriglobales bacterium]